MSDLVCISPIDGRVVAQRNYDSDAALEAALDKARRAQADWAATPLEERKRHIGRFLAEIERMNPELVPELAIQMGRPVRYGGELNSMRERINVLLAIAEEGLATYMPPQEPRIARKIKRVPKGVVLAIIPWNYPYLSVINPVIPALLAGNAVMMKHSVQTLLVADRVTEAFRAAGLPDGVFTSVHMNHETTARLIAARRFDHISFTGSVRGGAEIERAASGTFASLTLELGGKDPAYVRPDARLDFAAQALADGGYFNSGQCCCGVERVYVHEAVYDDFVAQLEAEASALVLGNPLEQETTLGPMASVRYAETVRAQVRQALARGARQIIDPSRFRAAGEGSAFVMPHLLVNVDHDMDVMRDETFGPVIGVMKVRSDEEAVALMNDSSFGLTASIWTQDNEAAERLGDRLQTGTVYMNRCDYADPYLAWAGLKDTGRGVSLSVLGFEGVTRPASFHLRSI
ncbi:aldehyde dehydrogenase family protein [Paracoccus versutus]|uniref:Acyl-CoA reductase-like NAD-dependent aldehyde dehydrogenase n=2 Tax=Paracoccus versutus TaxID=34007 RepID=A0A3D9XSL4_PARVE|nr:aldehyde dehydrogenase family protein [Paracoccus versutus]REF73430.1 acyl-CoA reductase-like NAD-dependent aldehyde dehydrogenase [Paracoccus versutus]WGR54553.1 aldehyde dehydrogenase family protein [Paracoccus versutus]